MKSKQSIIEEIKNEKDKDKVDLLCDKYLSEVSDDKLKGEIFYLKGFNSHYSGRNSDENFHMVAKCYENAISYGYQSDSVFSYAGLLHLSPEYNGYSSKLRDSKKATFYYKEAAKMRDDAYGYRNLAKAAVNSDPELALESADLARVHLDKEDYLKPHVSQEEILLIEIEALNCLGKFDKALQKIEALEKADRDCRFFKQGNEVDLLVEKANTMNGLGEREKATEILDYVVNMKQIGTSHNHFLGTKSKLLEKYNTGKDLLNQIKQNLKEVENDILSKVDHGDKIKVQEASKLINNYLDTQSKKQIFESKDEIIKKLVADNQDMKAQNQFLMDMIMQLNARLEKVEKNEQKLYCVTEVIYDNDLLNHPELLKLSVKEFGISRVLDMSNSLSSELISEAIGQNNAELLLAGCISLDCSDII